MYTRPGNDECAPFYQKYIDELPKGDILDILSRQSQEAQKLLQNLTETQAGFRYAADKWSIKGVVGHLTDAERVFVYRAMCFARNEASPLPGMDENAYADAAFFDDRKIADLVAEHVNLRAATVLFFSGLKPEAILRRGVANGVEFTVRACPYIIAGHERHHLEILKERYLSQIISQKP